MAGRRALGSLRLVNDYMKIAFVVLSPTPREQLIPFNAAFCQTVMAEQLAPLFTVIPTDSRSTCGDLMDTVLQVDRLIVLRSGVMATRASLERLAAAGAHEDSVIVGPIMLNGTPDQISQLPFSYADVETFQEVTDWLLENRKGATRQAVDLSDEVYCCSSTVWKQFPSDLPVIEIAGHDVWQNSAKIVAEDSIAHSFSNYYRHPRMDIIALIPENVRSILDVGCAEGAIGRYLKQHRPGIHCMGIEPDSTAAGAARQVYDRVINQTVEKANLSGKFDCIICGDVLEHLSDPQKVLTSLQTLLYDDGVLVGSVPNIGHWTVIRELMKGRFDYIPAGILCRDHLRFFTEDSLREMLLHCGYLVDYLGYNASVVSPAGKKFIEKLEAIFLVASASLACEQFVFRARKMSYR